MPATEVDDVHYTAALGGLLLAAACSSGADDGADGMPVEGRTASAFCAEWSEVSTLQSSADLAGSSGEEIKDHFSELRARVNEAQAVAPTDIEDAVEIMAEQLAIGERIAVAASERDPADDDILGLLTEDPEYTSAFVQLGAAAERIEAHVSSNCT